MTHYMLVTQGGELEASIGGMLKEDAEIDIRIMDPETRELKLVRAIISKDPDKLSDAEDTVEIKFAGVADSQDEIYKMKVIKWLERASDEEVEVKAMPHGRIPLGKRRGHMIQDMLRDRMKEKE